MFKDFCMSYDLNELFITLSFLHPTLGEKQKIARLAQQISDLHQLYALAKINTVVPWIYYRLKEENLWAKLNVENQKIWNDEAQDIVQINSKRIERALIVLSDFKAAQIPVIMLKGIMMAEHIYHNSFYKRMNDVDILIHPKDLAKIYQIYKKHGYFYVGERVGKDLGKQLKVSHHAPPFITSDLDCMFGTQWGLKSPFAHLKIDYENLWRRSGNCEFHGLSLQAMSAEDNVFHLCIHLGHFKSGTRDVMDLYNLIRATGADFDWKYFLRTVESSQAHSLCYHALSLVQAYDPRAEIKNVLDQLRPLTSTYFLKLAARKTKNLEVLLGHSSSYLAEIEKSISEFNLTDNFSQKLSLYIQTWMTILFPSGEEAVKLSCYVGPNFGQKFLAQILAPYRILRAIAHEIGGLLLLGLLVKSKLDLCKAMLKQLTSARSGETLEEKIQHFGIGPEQLARFKKLVQ